MTFFTIDEDHILPDQRDILAASAVLEITEYHLFELAYARWFGESPTEAKLENYFVGYMFKVSVPLWVRQYCREVLKQEDAGKLNPMEFGVHPRPESAIMARRGIRYIFVITFVVVAMHLIAILATAH